MERPDNNRVELEYETFGSCDNPAMILIQGLGAQMIGWRRELCEALADAGFFVIRFDNRDAGHSTWCPDMAYTLADMGDDIDGLLAAIGIDDAHVVGQSLGGMIAQQLALRHAQRVRSLCIVYSMPDTSYLSAGDDWLQQRFRPPVTTKAEAVERYLQDERWAASRDYPFNEHWIRELGAQMWERGYNPDGVARQLAAAESTPPPGAALAAIQVPTLLLHGDADRLVTVAGSRDLAEIIPHANLRIFEGMGHELPEALWPEIIPAIVVNAARADHPEWRDRHLATSPTS